MLDVPLFETSESFRTQPLLPLSSSPSSGTLPLVDLNWSSGCSQVEI
ncbi:MAG TPA: hypothetical protein VFG45_01710 [Candidatus Nitrosocosmicus sp.]|nr:hypothetical protein [Candidatus Nitrosocosmicus sp.]